MDRKLSSFFQQRLKLSVGVSVTESDKTSHVLCLPLDLSTCLAGCTVNEISYYQVIIPGRHFYYTGLELVLYRKVKGVGGGDIINQIKRLIGINIWRNERQ